MLREPAFHAIPSPNSPYMHIHFLHQKKKLLSKTESLNMVTEKGGCKCKFKRAENSSGIFGNIQQCSLNLIAREQCL